MGINLKVPNLTELRPRITVIGVGGAGGNAINNMIASGIKGVDFVAANTDAQALATSSAEYRIQLGVELTEGLGAGAKPEIGQAAAEEATDEIRSHIAGAHMVFIAAGMGGGTGTGAASVIARIARETGALTVAIVTKPFAFEGNRRMRMAEAGIAELNQNVDTLIVIPNQNLFRIANEKTTFAEAFLLADQVLHSGIACITDLIVREGLINLDFADVRTVMSGMGTAMMGTGDASGEHRAIQAAEIAILNPLLDDISLRGAKGLLISISGSRNLTLYEVDEAASRVRQEVDPEANIIVGATFDDSLGDRVRVSIVASGLIGGERTASIRPAPQPRREQPAATHQAQERSQQAYSPHAASSVAPEFDHAPTHVATARGPSWSLETANIRQDRDDLPHDDHAPAYPDEHEPPMALAPSGRHGESHGTDSGEVWRGPGDVVIELGPPQMPPPVHTLRGAGPSSPAQPRESAFNPRPPVEIRQSPRRIPELDEFPSVGQREYLAKRSAPPAAASYSAPEQTVEKRRPGLFARLTGLTRDSRRSDEKEDPRAGIGGLEHGPAAPASSRGPDLGRPDHDYDDGSDNGARRASGSVRRK